MPPLEPYPTGRKRDRTRCDPAASRPPSSLSVGDLMGRRLSVTEDIRDEEKLALSAALEGAATVKGGGLIVPPEKGQSLVVLGSGLASTYAVTPEGQRRTVGFYVPGDVVNLSSFFLQDIPHPVEAVSPCAVAVLPSENATALMAVYPKIRAALMRHLGLEVGRLRNWMMPRKPSEAIAYLYCDLFERYRAVGLAQYGKPLVLPLTQYHLASALGASLVHTNKTAKLLKSMGLLEFQSGAHRILNFEGLAEHAKFSSEDQD
jgi:CRP-like cAMP-binding protein